MLSDDLFPSFRTILSDLLIVVHIRKSQASVQFAL